MSNIHIHGGDVYRHPDVLDFSANCNPYGTPESVKKAAKEAVELVGQYPDVWCAELREALEATEQVPKENIICGNGAADLIFGSMLAQKPKKALLLAPSFAEYGQALEAVGCEIQYVYLQEEEGFVPSEKLLEYITEDLDVFCFCNPNNPTGILSKRNFVKKLADQCKACGVFFLLDECFLDFVENGEAYSMKAFLQEYPNLFLVKAFTKRYAMAGLRLGYGLCGNKAFLTQMRSVMQPWSVSIPAQKAGIAALQEKGYVRETLQSLLQAKKSLCEEMKKMGFFVFASQANYLFFKGPENLGERCLEAGIAIRDCRNYEGLDTGFYRVAVRREEENKKLLEVLKRCMESEVKEG